MWLPFFLLSMPCPPVVANTIEAVFGRTVTRCRVVGQASSPRHISRTSQRYHTHPGISRLCLCKSARHHAAGFGGSSGFDPCFEHQQALRRLPTLQVWCCITLLIEWGITESNRVRGMSGNKKKTRLRPVPLCRTSAPCFLHWRTFQIIIFQNVRAL